MSLSKVAPNCEICKTESGIYSCPRCNCKYCSSRCYKSPEHEVCSESFFREWVELSMRNKTLDRIERDKMLQILKKCQDEIPDTSDVCSDEANSIVDKFAGLNIDNVDENELWRNLSKKERSDFKSLIEKESNLEDLIQLKQPWWTVTMLNLVSEFEEKEEIDSDSISKRPHFPLDVKKLSCLTSKKPAECLQFNLVNVLYGYAFLYRFYNCDLKDFLEDMEYLFVLCPVLYDNKNYHSLEESVQDSIRLILSLNLNISLDFAKSIVNDVNSILQGPENSKPSTFVLCALHDIEILLLETKTMLDRQKDVSRTLRKKIMPAVKKIEYFMSWSLDFEDNLSDLASHLLLLMLPELLSETENLKSEESSKEIVQKPPLIEEII